MKIIFFHMPKVAGESLRKIMPDGTFFIGHNFYHNEYKHLVYDIEKYLQRFVLSFVRNPYDRAVSAFFYLNAGGNNPLDEIEKEKYIAKYNGDFNVFVENAFPEILNQIHFMPQYSWIYYCHEINTMSGPETSHIISLCNYVGKFETINDDLKELSKIIPLKSIELPQLNKSKHSHYEDYYTSKTKKIIYNCYEKDFKLFGYEE